MSRDLIEDTSLHAFVDGQLGHDERERMLAELEHDEALREQLCKLRNTKELVAHAYTSATPPAREPRAQNKERHFALLGTAALLMLAFGFMAGWYCHTPLGREATVLSEAQSLAPSKVMLHIANADATKYEEVLYEAEQLLAEYAKRGIQVEVVANSDGMDLLRTDTSPYVERIRAMMQQYNDLRFVACSNTIARLEREGLRIMLIDETQVAPSAVEHIVQRLQQGWAYIKV